MRPLLVRVALFLVALALALPLFLDTHSRAAPTPEPRPAPTVRVATVEAGPSERLVVLDGVTRADDAAALSFTVAGRLDERPVSIGSTISSGDVIARLDRRPFRLAEQAASSQVAELEAALAQRDRDLRRAERLRDSAAASDEEVEQLQAAIDRLRASIAAAEAAEDEAERRIREAVLRAPFDGVVTAVLLEPGEFAAPGVPVVHVSGNQHIEVELGVPERWIADLAVDQPVHVSFPLASADALGDQPIVAHITAIADAAGGPGRLFPVVVTLPDEAMARPGLSARVAFAIPVPDAVLVPPAAIVAPSGVAPRVLRVRRDQTGERHVIDVVPVELARDQGGDGDVAVRGDLAAGDVVIVAGHLGLTDGSTVSLTEASGGLADRTAPSTPSSLAGNDQ